MNEENKRFFDEFDYPDYNDWKDAAVKALKGKPFDKVMFTDTYEDITLEPIYTKEHIAELEHIKNRYPGFYPFVRGTKTIGAKAEPWEINQEIPYPDPKKLNEALKNDIQRGQSSILIKAEENFLKNGNCGFKKISGKKTLITNTGDFETILEDIELPHLRINLDGGIATPQLAALFAAYCDKNEIDTQTLNGSFKFDPVAYLAEYGKTDCPAEKYLDEMAEFIKWSMDNFPKFRVFEASGDVYHNGGGSAVQELAYTMSATVYYLNAMLERGIDINDAASRLKLSFSTGSNFFMEIAKLRAARVNFAKIVRQFGGSEDSAKAYIHANTSIREKTKYDPYVNMLRNTSQAFSAVTGGCDSLNVTYFDRQHCLPDDFSRRMSRNTQIILNEEAHVNDNTDPAGGSWFVEALTDQIARKAWELFQKTESEGGILKALENKTIQNSITEKYNERVKKLSVRKETILGTNKYPNLQEKKVQPKVKFTENDFESYDKTFKEFIAKRNEPDLSGIAEMNENYFNNSVKAAAASATGFELYKSLISNCDKQKTEAIPLRRNAKIFERIRDKTLAFKDKHGITPKVDLVCLGLLRQYKPRADFAVDFYQVGGFSHDIHDGFESPADAAMKMKDKASKVMIICSTDEIYEEFVPEFASKIKAYKPGIKLVLAGFPKDKAKEYKKAGVDEFIHIKANNYQMLAETQKYMGID